MYALNEPILNVDICIERLVIVDHPSSSDQQLLTLQERKYREGGEWGGRQEEVQ